MAKIGVGIIGMQIDRSWSAIAHVPALRAIPGYEIRAVATTRQDSADRAAAHYSIPQAYAGHEALVSSSDVDLLVVTTKVPAHRELVLAALGAGKHVYCEWPLGNGLSEAREMADLARSSGVMAIVGLQARVSPTICYVRDLVAQGYVGKVLSSSLIGTGMSWGTTIESANAYLADRSNGATMLTIPMGHTLDAACSVLGELEDISAILANGCTQTTIIETGQTIQMTAPDQIGLVGRTTGGAILTAQYRAGMGPGTGLLWEIYGDRGAIRVSAASGHAQVADLALEGSDRPDSALQSLAVPDRYYHSALRSGPALNVAEMYHRLANDLQEGTQSCPGFADAVVRHAMLEKVEASAPSLA